MPAQYFIGIDPGLKNLACVVLREEHVVFSKIFTIGNSKTRIADIAPKIQDMLKALKKYITKNTVAVIENQMQKKMIVVQACLQTAFIERKCRKTIIAHPRSVKKKFNISGKSYKQNKKLAVEFATERIPEVICAAGPKCDDISDAYILALYGKTQ